MGVAGLWEMAEVIDKNCECKRGCTHAVGGLLLHVCSKRARGTLAVTRARSAHFAPLLFVPPSPLPTPPLWCSTNIGQRAIWARRRIARIGKGCTIEWWSFPEIHDYDPDYPILNFSRNSLSLSRDSPRDSPSHDFIALSWSPSRYAGASDHYCCINYRAAIKSPCNNFSGFS